MKKIAVLLAIFLLLGMTACGHKTNETISNGTNTPTPSSVSNQGQNQITKTPDKSVVTSDDLLAALESSGYITAIDTTLTPSDLAAELGDGIVEATVGEFAKWFDAENYFGETGLFIYASMTDESSAIALYEKIFREMAPLSETSGQGFSKATYTAKVGDPSVYGETIIISRVKNTVIYFNVDWDDCQDINSYNHDAARVLESLGY